MATRTMKIATGEYYHVYNRGVEKRDIFLDKEDREYFLKSLYGALSDSPLHQSRMGNANIFNLDIQKKLVSIGSYVLMPNHYHILVRCKDVSDFSSFMNKFQTSYAMYFNKKYNRSGRLFQGTYKSKHITNDTYLKYLFAYIHLNPVKIIDKNWKENGIKDISKALTFLSKYSYSSFLDYTGTNRKESKILDTYNFPLYFKKKSNFKDHVRWWLEYKKMEVENILEVK